MNINTKLATIQEYFSPKVIGDVNDTFVKVAKIKGNDLPWHSHEQEDEFFYIIKGALLFEIENAPSFEMQAGDYFTVPKGVLHRVSSKEECHILLVEKNTTQHTGSVESPLTKSITSQLQ